jgi:pimeloyl-ACP methyl ester carboxylesterase
MAAKHYAPHHQEVLKALNAVDFDKIETRKEAEAILQEHLSDPGTRQFLLKNIYRKEDEPKMGWRFNLEVITRNHENVGVEVPYQVSNTPSLIIRGGKSRYVNDTDLEDFKRRYPHHRFATIEGAGHWVHAEKPNEFFEEVLRFIKDPAL